MAFIGNTNTTQAFTPAIDYFSGNGSTTAFTLSRPIASVAQVQVVVNNVAQNPSSAYTVSGNTITFTSAPSSGTNNIYVYYTSPITQVVALPQNPQVFGNLQFSSSGARITGDFSNATVANRVMFQTSTVNGASRVGIIPNGTSVAGELIVFNNSDTTNAGIGSIRLNTTDFAITSTYNGSGTFLPMTFITGGSERMRVDTSGNVGIGTSSPDQYGRITSSAGATQVSFMSFGQGTAGYPSFGFAGQVTANGGRGAGMYLPADGTLAFSTVGSERVRIDSSGNLLFNSGYGSVATAYGCRAWVNFNGTGTVAIRASGNVSSITDGGVGIYRVNFTSSMPDANFTTVASSAGAGSVNNSTTAMLVNATSSTAQTANAAYVDVWCYHPGNQVAQDDAYINVSVFR